MTKLYLFIIAVFCYTFTKAQVSINLFGTPPAASAMLDVSSTNRGVLIPQVSIDSLKDVTSIPSPANGLLVYNTTQPGVRNDMSRGYYWYSTAALTWVKLADNITDNVWKPGGLGVQLRDTTDGVEIMDGYTGSSLNYNPKLRILKKIDSALMNSKNNITALVITGVNRKSIPGWEFRQKTSIIFENNYLVNGNTAGRQDNVAISAYTENTGTVQTTQSQGLAFYVTAPPQNTATLDTPSMAMYRHNVGIGAYPTDVNQVTEGRLQITGFSNGDQLSLRHPSSINLKWGLYVSSIDSSLNFYNDGNLRAKIDRVTGIYTAVSDRNRKKNIRPMTSVLETVMRLPAYSFNYFDSRDNDRRMLGFMAQDVQPFFPELVYQGYDRELSKPLLTMDYSGLGVIAIKAIQEQQLIITSQEQRIKALEEEMNAIKVKLGIGK
jgi:Chaperone of endosialidase